MAAPLRRFFALGALVLLASVGGCDLISEPHGGLLDEIEANRATWEAQRPQNYTYVLQHRCFCGQEAIGPVEVEVQGTTVVRRTYTGSGEEVSAQFESAFPIVEVLFTLLEEAAEADADDIQASFDPVLGVPVDFFIDYSDNIADEERGYEVLELPSEVAGG